MILFGKHWILISLKSPYTVLLQLSHQIVSTIFVIQGDIIIQAMRAQSIGWNAASKTGIVAAGAAEAVAAGIEILARGGNAADAAAATILALNVTDHGACSIGGEVPVLIFDAQKQAVKSLSGQGGAPRAQAAIDWYMENGIPNADMKMAPVPSVVDLCITLLQHSGANKFWSKAASICWLC